MSTDTSQGSSAAEPRRESTDEPLVIDGISYIPSSALLSGTRKISFKDNRAFGVVDPRGDSPRIHQGSELGFYFNDTRYLGTWESTLNGYSPISLADELRFGGNTVLLSMTNRDLPKLGDSGRIPRDTLLVRKLLTLVDDTVFELLEIKNFDSVPQTVQVEYWAGGRFEDIFEVRGFPRAKRGRLLPIQEDERTNALVFQYQGLDLQIRRTYIHRLFRSEKIRISPNLAGYFVRVTVPPKDSVYLKTIISFDRPSDGMLRGHSFKNLTFNEVAQLLLNRSSGPPFSSLEITTDNEIMNRAIANAKTDINMLLTVEPPQILYPYAGIPWFSAPFGRDGIITAYQMLPWHPDLARGVLDYVFTHLGSKADPFTDEQPGKVFHEMRRGDMANTREVPFIPYYGSVDSTPLALILLTEYVSWTKDHVRLREWWPQAMKALEWLEHWGDGDRDGFLEYAKQSPTGLVNQGWKDSHDSIMHADGRWAQAPIRLCEVQAYAFRARMGMSALARILGKEDLANELRLTAMRLRTQFLEAYWDARREYIYLALDSEMKPCAVRSSNMGQCLWGQILWHAQARAVSEHLMSDEMFSGFGIRTLASSEVAYNPLSYHNGSIWPHDNSLIMEGLRFYGLNGSLNRLALAMIHALESTGDFRLPELYCGFKKRGVEPPIPYEVACKPQAWAAGSIFLMLKSMLGLAMDPDQDHLVFRAPFLTSKMSALQIKNLHGKDWELDLNIFSAGAGGIARVEVARRSGSVQLLRVRQ